MIQRPASRILSVLPRYSRRQVSAKYFHSQRPSASHHHHLGNFSHLLGNLPTLYPSSLDDDRPKTSYRPILGLPRITLDDKDPLVLMAKRSFTSSTALSSSSSPSSPSTSSSSSNDSTFRERMEARRDHGRQVATKGAHSLRGMIQKYGPVFLGTYMAVYFTTLGTLFAGVESGILDPAYVLSWVTEDPDSLENGTKTTAALVAEFMDHYAWTRPYKSYVETQPALANLGVAWIAVKFTEPIRFGTTVAIVPRLSRYLGYTSKEDPKEPSPEIKEGTIPTTTTSDSTPKQI